MEKSLVEMNEKTNRVLALSGIFQAAALTKELAWQGKCEEKYLLTNINSLFSLESKSVLEIYQDIGNLKIGLKEIINFFDKYKSNTFKSPEIARYTFSLIHLERKLIKDQKMLDIIQSGIIRAKNQSKIFSPLHENVMANLAGIYTDTLSTFPFRIQVIGNQAILNNNDIANKIRAVLLAGIRSAVLWRQLGGSKWHFIFFRKQIATIAKNLLKVSLDR